MSAQYPRVIALSFYDGPTEGFVKDLLDDCPYFFKVVAWDDNQDRRLYLLGRVKESDYQELLEILLKSNQLNSGETIVPEWTFVDDMLLSRANTIVERSRGSLANSELIILGENLIDSFEIFNPSDLQLVNARILAGADMPSSLGGWLKLTGSG